MKRVSMIACGAVAVTATIVAGMTPALAHTGVAGHGHGGLAAGMMHPLGGIDHLLAMLAVGIWSAIAARGQVSRLWIAPLAFVVAMLAGALSGYAGLALPLVETGIALSVVVLGIMILGRIELSSLAAAGLMALFAIYHGYAHGAEAVGSISGYMAGFALTTTILHIGGIALGVSLLATRLGPSVFGGLVAGAGAYLLSV